MTNYWEARIERLNKETFRNSDKYVRELRKLYEQEINNIEEKIYNHLCKLKEEAGGISLFEAKKLLSDKELNLFKMDLDGFMKRSQGNISPELEKELNIISRRVRISTLQVMEVEIKKTVAGLMTREEKGLFAHLGRTYERRYYKELYELQRITGYDSVRKISKEDLKIILNNPWTSDGREFSERIWGRGDKLVNSLRDNLTRNIASGASPKESIKDIESQFNVSKAAASRLVYTETAAISSKATQDSYKRIGVKKYEILATLDLRTSDICRIQDGKTYDIKDYRVGITAPPFHPNCRTDTIPFFDDDLERQLDKNVGRSARNPKTKKTEIVENISYEDWHKKYVERATNNNQNNRVINFFDSIDEWKEVPKGEAKKVEDLQRWEHDGQEYKVDGKHVVLDYSRNEKEVADVIAKEYGKDIKMVPRVLNPPGIKTPDYIIDGEKWDLKTLSSKGKNVFYNLTKGKKEQANNFIFDISNIEVEDNWVENQIKSIYDSKNRNWIKCIIVIKNKVIIRAYKRK